MIFVFYRRLAFDAFKDAGYLRRRLRRGELRQAVVISVKRTSQLICDYFEDYFGCRVISSTTTADGILLETQPQSCREILAQHLPLRFVYV